MSDPLPPGFVGLGCIALHVATIRENTSDFDRFMRCYEAANALAELKPGSEEAVLIYERFDVGELSETLYEIGELFLAESEKLAKSQQ